MAKRTKSVKQTQPADSGGKTLSEFFGVLRRWYADMPPVEGYQYLEAFSPAYLMDRIEEDLQAGQVSRAVMQAVTLGAELKRLANWPAVASQLKRLARKAEAEKTKGERDARQAHDMMECERAKAGSRYFDWPTAIREVARQLDVDPVTVKRRLKRYTK